MRAAFGMDDPVPRLLDDLVDGLHLLHECRQRGVVEVDRLLEYIDYLVDEIERHRLGMSARLFHTMLDPGRVNDIAWSEDLS